MSNEKQMAEILMSIGIPAHIKGYRYILDALEIIKKDPLAMDKGITKYIYPEIAGRHTDATPSRVERAIRFAIETAFDKESLGWMRVFKYSGLDRPTNMEFLATLAEVVRLKLVS